MGEIETCAAHFEGIKQAVAVIRPIAGSDALCLYYTTAFGVAAIDSDELRRYMSRLLADYMVPAAFMQLDTLPLMPNGKVDRRQLPEPLPAAHADYVAPQTKTEDTLARLTGDVLSSSKPISMADNFFALGGDSIKIIRLVSLLRNEGYTAQVSELMQCSTLLDMASILVSCNEGSSISQEPVVGTVMPGAIQQCFLSWHLSQPGRFTQSVVLRASQPIDATCLQQALQVLVVHHDMLRAKVNDNDNENRCIYIRSITDDHLFALREVILPAQTDVAQAIAQASNDEGELIDLQHGPLLRVVLLHTEDGDRLLMVCHHIACDGVSWRIITEDLSTALTQLSKGQSISLPPKTHSFGYWTNTIARYRDSYLLSQEKPYWQRVQALMENMELTRTHDGNQVKQHLTVTLEGEPLRHLLSTSAKAYNTEINDLLITALCQAYYRQTGNTNLTIQMEGHGREPLHESVVTDRTVGWFTSVYPLVINGISGDVHNDVRQVKELLRAVPNKGIGYGILQYISSQEMDDALRVDLTPLVGFNYLGEAVSSSKGTLFTVDSSFLLSESLTSGQLGVPTPSIDINCTVVEGRFIALFEYDTACWTSERAQQLADGFVDSIIQVAEHTANVAIPDPTASDFGAVGWTEKQFQNIISHFESRGERLQRVYPLTPMQEGMLVTYLTNRETTAYRLVTRLSMSMLPTEARLRNTLDYLAEKHEVLRTAILYDSVPNPCQTIVSRRLGLEMHDLTNEPDIEAAATRIHQEELHRPLSLTDDPLFRLVCMKTGDNSCQLIVFMHHIITDGWCLPIIFSDFLMKMEAESSQQISDSSTPTLTHPRSYETFVRQLLRRDRKAGLAYWKNLLAGYDTRAAIPSYGKPAGTEAKPFIRHTLDEALTASLRQLAAKTGVTLNTVMELGWGLVLQTFCRTNDAVFLRVVSGRDNSDSDNSQLVGMFINSVPVRVHTIGTETIASSLQSLQEQAAQSAYYDFCPLSDIQQRTGLGTSLYQSVMAFENYPLSETLSTAGRQWAIKPVQIEEEAFGELSITISPETNGTLRLTFTYDTSLYGEQQMQQVADTFETIVRNMAAMPDGQLRELSLVTEEARNELIELGTGKHIDIAPHMTFVKAFERRASQHPDNLAVADASDSLTYGELLRRSNILAHRLIESGIKPGDFVAVMLDRTIDYPLAVLAIHK
ncbi:MAG: condensation domain-containing protein, partial [Prevotella sp.]